MLYEIKTLFLTKAGVMSQQKNLQDSYLMKNHFPKKKFVCMLRYGADWLKITVHTQGNWHWKKTITFKSAQKLEFKPGHISSFSVSADDFDKYYAE